MMYNFKDIFENKEAVYQEFINDYTTDIDVDTHVKAKKIAGYYKSIFNLLNSNFKTKTLLDVFEKLTKYKISLDTPYGIVVNEIHWIQSSMIDSAIVKDRTDSIATILQLFKEITNSIAYLYLMEYVSKLISSNNIRRSSLSDLTEKSLIVHYEAHLIWVTDLAEHIQERNQKEFPQLDHTLCAFGKWLHNDGKKIIQNNSKYKAIYEIHEKLHQFAHKIYQILNDYEYNALITYLEKCELISLGIGTELALLDQILINKRITKDPLTGSLNRHGLQDLFESQYELALATNNHFVLAMCDLDYFKQVNDTYGHVAGDRVLKLFVEIVKKNIRNSDMIIRYGGEEFVIILPTLNKKIGYSILNKIRQEFEDTELRYEEHTIKATVSIGMLEISPEHLFLPGFTDEYIMIADRHLYMAKEAGRNRVEVH